MSVLKLGAYQFPVTGSIERNLAAMENAILRASKEGIGLLAFPECALTGYPPVSIPDADIDPAAVRIALERIRQLTDRTGVACLTGTIAEKKGHRFDRTVFFAPGNIPEHYDKRILGGWDAKHFTEGETDGIFSLNGCRIAVRICFEVRFPELFREAYMGDCDLVIVQFADTTAADDEEYYRIIDSHLRTRAAENTIPIMSVNTSAPFQGAPTAFYDSDGRKTAEAGRGTECLLIYEFDGRCVTASGKRRQEWIGKIR